MAEKAETSEKSRSRSRRSKQNTPPAYQRALKSKHSSISTVKSESQDSSNHADTDGSKRKRHKRTDNSLMKVIFTPFYDLLKSE